MEILFYGLYAFPNINLITDSVLYYVPSYEMDFRKGDKHHIRSLALLICLL